MGCKNFQFMMMIDFYALLLRKKVHKSFMYNTKLKFLQSALENRCKNFKFPMIIDFYTLFLEGREHKFFIYNAKSIFIQPASEE